MFRKLLVLLLLGVVVLTGVGVVGCDEVEVVYYGDPYYRDPYYYDPYTTYYYVEDCRYWWEGCW